MNGSNKNNCLLVIWDYWILLAVRILGYCGKGVSSVWFMFMRAEQIRELGTCHYYIFNIISINIITITFIIIFSIISILIILVTVTCKHIFHWFIFHDDFLFFNDYTFTFTYIIYFTLESLQQSAMISNEFVLIPLPPK